MQKPFIFPGTDQSSLVYTSDNFYVNPDAVREFALGLTFYTCSDYVGSRSDTFLFDNTKKAMEEILQTEITDWENSENGRFEIFAGGDTSPIHWEKNYQWTGYVFLKPDPPAESGITLQRHKATNSFFGYEGLEFNPLDKFQFDRADVLGNIYNRLVLLQGSLLRNYTEYFGWDIESGMMVQTFKFNVGR